MVDVAAAALALSTEVLLAGNRKATNTDIGDRGGRRKDVRGCQGGTDSALGFRALLSGRRPLPVYTVM